MRKLLGLGAAVLSASIFATSTASAFDPASAATVFARMAASPTLSNPSVSLIDVSTGKVVFESNANSQRKPASLMKLLSASATLRYLDPSKVFATSVALGPTPDSIVIDGEYDPWISMNSKEALKMGRTSFYALASRGLSAVTKKSEEPVKKLQVYYNDLFSKDVANFKAYYKKRGVSATMIYVNEAKAKSLATEQIVYSTSPTVKEIMNWFLVWSDNIVSERMARLAAKAAGNDFNEKGVAKTFDKVLRELGIDPSRIIIKDASGLSKENKLTANILSQLLYKIHSDPVYSQLIGGLPVSGKTGTLSKRYIESAPQAVGLVKAKTGTLSGTVSLAGYVQSGDREYAFTIIADQIGRTNAASERARKTLDIYLGKIAAPLMLPIAETATATIG
jgi:D-alanyl-D-alanine carboxypeptidase/D-alanyl-D-alanine-endopeptidase (penicillin-binding protein 4)